MMRLGLYLAIDCALFIIVLILFSPELLLAFDRQAAQATIVEVREQRGLRSTRYPIRYQFMDAQGLVYEGSAVLADGPWDQHPRFLRTIEIYYSTLNPSVSRVARPFFWVWWLVVIGCLAVFGYLTMRIVARFKRYGWRAID